MKRGKANGLFQKKGRLVNKGKDCYNSDIMAVFFVQNKSDKTVCCGENEREAKNNGGNQ